MNESDRRESVLLKSRNRTTFIKNRLSHMLRTIESSQISKPPQLFQEMLKRGDVTMGDHGVHERDTAIMISCLR